ncbi:MAG: SurA N-terminal domain-containing protein [Deltaproteobacteria bacterium]|nr:SurA N-terminal domain-containing protein [Deltaproteobacteria bacterium]
MIHLLTAAALGGVLVDRLAAIVNDEAISYSEIYDLGAPFISDRCPDREAACVRRAELEVLDALVQRALVQEELRRLDLLVTGTDVDQAIDRVVAEYGMDDRQALRAEVERQGLRWDAYREQISEQLATQRFQGRVIAPRVAVTEDEIVEAYQKAVGPRRALQVEAFALGIAIPPETPPNTMGEMALQASQLVTAINAEEITWEQAIAQYDGAKIASVFGGKVWRKGEMLPPLDAVAFDESNPVGTAIGPIKVNNLLVLIEVTKRDVGEAAAAESLDALRPKLQNEIFARKLEQAEEEWYQISRRQATVLIVLEEPAS